MSLRLFKVAPNLLRVTRKYAKVIRKCIAIVHGDWILPHVSFLALLVLLGVPTKNSRMNKQDSSVLQSKNQVTLFVNYSYIGFYDFRSSENI